MYLVAILLPPLAVLLKGKPIQALLNVGLTLLLWIPGVIHAWGVVSAANADARSKRQTKTLERAIRDSKS
jgi:uncharacterized membrane protein YqaE (UPF0057 family)